MYAIVQLQFALRQFARNTSGAVATEYAFLIAFIAIVAALGMVLLGTNLSTFFDNIGTALTDISSDLPDPFGNGS